MNGVEYTPSQLLSLGLGGAALTEQPWRVRWDGLSSPAHELLTAALPPLVDFETSGSTGPPRTWRRLRENVLAEARLVAGLLAADRPEAVLSFVPPKHIYGAMASILAPALLGLPVWYKPSPAGPLPPPGRTRWAVMATPWIFTLLLRQIEWVHAQDSVVVLYGGAMLPATAGTFLAQARGRATIVEILGSTEAGAVASRRWATGDPPVWTLLPDVRFATPGRLAGADDVGQDAMAGDDGASETRLTVSGPRLAFPPDGGVRETWTMDDYVHRLDDRRFRLSGRRERLVKINGRRVNLDELQDALRDVLDCADLALRTVADPMIGEHAELLVVPGPGRTLADVDLTKAFAVLGFRPRRVHSVERIDRSATGKLRHTQTMVPGKSEVQE